MSTLDHGTLMGAMDRIAETEYGQGHVFTPGNVENVLLLAELDTNIHLGSELRSMVKDDWQASADVSFAAAFEITAQIHIDAMLPPDSGEQAEYDTETGLHNECELYLSDQFPACVLGTD